MSEWLILAASAAVVAFMVLVAAVLGFRKRVILNAAELERLAREEGDGVEEALVDAQGRQGVARLRSGKVLIARVMGDGVGARVVNSSVVHANKNRAGVKIVLSDLGFPPVQLKLKEAPPAWLTALGVPR